MSHFEEIKKAFLGLDRVHTNGSLNEKPARTTFEQKDGNVVITFDTLDTDKSEGYYYKIIVAESLKASGPRMRHSESGKGVTLSGGDGHVIKIEQTSQYRDASGNIVNKCPKNQSLMDDMPKFVITLPDNKESVFKINNAKIKHTPKMTTSVSRARMGVEETLDQHALTTNEKKEVIQAILDRAGISIGNSGRGVR